ncbi:MAG TPA: hypothetical protein VIU15_23875, partial [Streptomyces sp.]
LAPRSMAHLDDLLAGTEVTLSDDVLDRIDAIVPPGTDTGTLDVAHQPQAARRSRRRAALYRWRPGTHRRRTSHAVHERRPRPPETPAEQRPRVADRAGSAR